MANRRTFLGSCEVRKYLFLNSEDIAGSSVVMWASALISRLPFQSLFVEQP